LWVSALIPAIASLYNRYRIEYPAILLVTAGVAIYAANIWAQVPDTHTRVTQALTVTAVAVGLTLRWLNRRRLVAWAKDRNARAAPDHHAACSARTTGTSPPCSAAAAAHSALVPP